MNVRGIHDNELIVPPVPTSQTVANRQKKPGDLDEKARPLLFQPAVDFAALIKSLISRGSRSRSFEMKQLSRPFQIDNRK
jgi:hypothetical protein